MDLNAIFLVVLWLFTWSSNSNSACVITCIVRKLMDRLGIVMCRRNQTPRRGTLLLLSFSALIPLKRKGLGLGVEFPVMIMWLLILLSWFNFIPLYVFSLESLGVGIENSCTHLLMPLCWDRTAETWFQSVDNYVVF